MVKEACIVYVELLSLSLAWFYIADANLISCYFLFPTLVMPSPSLEQNMELYSGLPVAQWLSNLDCLSSLSFDVCLLC